MVLALVPVTNPYFIRGLDTPWAWVRVTCWQRREGTAETLWEDQNELLYMETTKAVTRKSPLILLEKHHERTATQGKEYNFI